MFEQFAVAVEEFFSIVGLSAIVLAVLWIAAKIALRKR